MATTPTYESFGALLTAPNPTAGLLHDLCVAVDATAPITGGVITFDADAGNSGSVFIGDKNVSTTRYMKKLAASGTYTLFVGSGNVRLSSLYILGSAASQKVAVGVVQAAR